MGNKLNASLRRNACFLAIVAELKRQGIDDFEMVPGGKNPRVVYRRPDGAMGFIPFGISASRENRAPLNTVASLRRSLARPADRPFAVR